MLWPISHKTDKAASKSITFTERLAALSINDLPLSHRVARERAAPIPQESSASGPSIDRLWNGRMTSRKRRTPRRASATAAIAK